FTERGVVLSSGDTIEADIVVPATGLRLQFLGGMTMELDGEPVDCGKLVNYRGMMFANVPNWVALFGYTNASWTLRVDLTADYVCRLLHHMRDNGYTTVVPRLDDKPRELRPMMASLKSGYVMRAAAAMPKQASEAPWVNNDNYLQDRVSVKFGKIDDGTLEFGRRINTPLAVAGKPTRRPSFGYDGKTAVVTGAASGIGKAVAEALSRRGCHLALVDRDEAGLEAVARGLTGPGRVRTYVVDMGEATEVRAFPERVLADFDGVDLLLNNAGVALGGTFEEASAEEFEWLMNINFFGVVNMTRALLPHLKQRPEAHIANVSSVFGMVAPPGQTAYCASKYAVRGFSESLRHELSDSSVGVSLIHPGGIKTNIAKSARVAASLTKQYRSEDIEREAREFERNFITTPEKVAEAIVAGIERRDPRILIGPDARMIEVLERLFPITNVNILGSIARAGIRRKSKKQKSLNGTNPQLSS
ncbi:MAG: SDR family NAD(P)-dependent oxidoreductase, partial [Myxococcota bacterium]